MGSLLSKYVCGIDRQEPEPGNAVFTVVVDKSFLAERGTTEFITPMSTVFGESLVLRVIKQGNEAIIVELQSRNSHPLKICCVLSVVSNNENMAPLSTAMSCATISPEHPHAMKLPIRPRTIADPELHFITAKGCFTLKLFVRVRKESIHAFQGNELWSPETSERLSNGRRVQITVIKWFIRNVFPFDRCTFVSNTFELKGRTLYLKFCPKGLTGEDETASIHLFSEAGSELKGRLWCSIQKANSDKPDETHGDFLVSPWKNDCLRNIVESRALIEEESGFLSEGWLRMLIGIKLPAKKKKIAMFETEPSETDEDEEDEAENHCLICKDATLAVAALVHDDGSCKVVCQKHALALDRQRNALCPKCQTPFRCIEYL